MKGMSAAFVTVIAEDTKKCYKWRIYIVKFWTRPPPGFKFFQFHAVFGKFWQNRMLVLPLESWRPLLGEILVQPLVTLSWPEQCCRVDFWLGVQVPLFLSMGEYCIQLVSLTDLKFNCMALLAMTAHSASQSSMSTSKISVHKNRNNTSYNNDHSLISKTLFTIIARNVANFLWQRRVTPHRL